MGKANQKRVGGNGKKGGGKNQTGKRNRSDTGMPQPSKAGRFTPTDDDNCCNNLATVLGPEKKQTECFVLLLALGLGVQLRGYDSVDFALPMEGNCIRELHRETIENKWTLPPFNLGCIFL